MADPTPEKHPPCSCQPAPRPPRLTPWVILLQVALTLVRVILDLQE